MWVILAIGLVRNESPAAGLMNPGKYGLIWQRQKSVSISPLDPQKRYRQLAVRSRVVSTEPPRALRCGGRSVVEENGA
jgi:hypothetical protein